MYISLCLDVSDLNPPGWNLRIFVIVHLTDGGERGLRISPETFNTVTSSHLLVSTTQELTAPFPRS